MNLALKLAYKILKVKSQSQLSVECKRSYAVPKRFYKNTNVLYSDGKFEVTLDHRKLKTPLGKPFNVKSEPLAIAVAAEWENQEKTIVQTQMHLTALCFTAIDNPNRLTKQDMVNYLLNFLPTDTVLYQSEEKDLSDLQKNEWGPLIDWFNKRYETNLQKTLSIAPPYVSAEDKMKISKYFLSHSDDTMHGFVFAVDTLHSIVIACAVVDQHISIEKAVSLARLEEEYQVKFWGRVEWAHDLSQQEQQARLSAAVLFIHLNRSEIFVKEKLFV